MKRTKKILLVLFVLFPVILLSTPMTEKYTAYSYVFSEFEVDDSFVYDEGFEAFVAKNEKKIKNFYVRSLERGNTLMPLVQRHLMEGELSDLLMYISMVESGFNSDIVSPKKAVGLWQFMPATAKHYRLSVCDSYDERCDPETATKAAMRYLKKLHKQFGKWYLAVMAYNCGEGRLAKAIKRAGTDDLSTLLNSYEKYLPKETREYIQKILLVALIGESEAMDFENSSDAFLQVEVNGGLKLKSLAKLLDMEYAKLQKLNTQFKKGTIPTKKDRYKITIPEEKMILFYLRYDLNETGTTKTQVQVKPHLISHYVHMGDTLEKLAEEYNSTVEEIKLANKLEDDALTLDKLLLIPVNESLFERLLEE